MCDFGSLSIGELCRETRQSRGRPAATGASVPAVRQASRRLTSVLSCLAVEIRTVCDSCRFVTSLTVLSIPAPQRVPRRREKRAPAIWAAAASADARPVRAPWYERSVPRLVFVRVRRELRDRAGSAERVMTTPCERPARIRSVGRRRRRR